MRPLTVLIPLATVLALPTLATGLSTPTTPVDWADATTSSTDIDGVRAVARLSGSASLYAGTPAGPHVGATSGADDLTLTFDTAVEEICFFIHYNDAGESLSLYTNGLDPDAFRAIDDGAVTTTVTATGSFSWSGTAGSDDTAACVSNADGFTEVTVDHDGTGGGLVLGEAVVFDGAVDRVHTYWYSGADEDSVCGSTGSWESDLLGGGGGTVVESSAWPGTFVGLRRMFVACPSTDLTTDQKDDLIGLIEDGGVVVVVGESDEEMGYVGSANDLLAALGVDGRLVSDDLSAATHTGWSALVDGVSGAVSSPSSSQVSNGPHTEPVVATGAGEVVLAVEGSVVISGDADFWSRGGGAYPGNRIIKENLVSYSVCEAVPVYLDGDEDGYGGGVSVGLACAAPEGHSIFPDDCDDSDAAVSPEGLELPYDGVDQDCSGGDLCDVDLDGFDHPLCGGLDCADDVGAVNPAADEVWYDNVDQDCDGWSDFDADWDGFDSLEGGGTDCDDADPAVHVEADEVWYDGVDQNCDGASDFDRDGDGVDRDLDCDDGNSTVFPGAFELADGLDNDCNGVAEDDDNDGDGVADEVERALGMNPVDSDSDGDGVVDGDELGSLADLQDTDRDGLIDPLDQDDDGDGLATAFERASSLKGPDSDRDGVPDYLDLDSDGDGFDDAVEGSADPDYDGVPNHVDPDSDEDGVADKFEAVGDSDADGVPDRLDLDDDGDGLPTIHEGGHTDDADGDGTPNYLDVDSDGDGLSDATEGWADSDCDGSPDVVDAEVTGPGCDPVTPVTFQSSCSAVANPAGPAGVLVGLLVFGRVRRRR